MFYIIFFKFNQLLRCDPNTNMSNKEQQADELLALEAIYAEEYQCEFLDLFYAKFFIDNVVIFQYFQKKTSLLNSQYPLFQ